jgi:methyltransferase (TIGR00027 family)
MKFIPESFAGVATAGTRAVELYQPEHMRLFDDRIGWRLLPPGWKIFLGFFYLPGLRQLALALRDKRMPGSLGGILLRTRYIDDTLVTKLNTGLDQVVVLGAGFDTRAYRIPGMEKTRVFDVDLPGTMALKKKRLKDVIGEVPDHVTLVGINFDKEDLADVLIDAGYRADKHTFFIWEGVTQYLSADAVRDTLAFVAESSGEGSGIVFTYIRKDLFEGLDTPDWFQGYLDFAARVGSPVGFGLEPGGLRDYLADLGLFLVSDVGAEEYKKWYLDPIGRELSIFDIERAAYAEVHDLQGGREK